MQTRLAPMFAPAFVIGVAIACSKDDPAPKAKSTESKTTAASSPAATVTAATPVKQAGNVTDADVCASPCLLLKTTSYDSAGKEYCARCGKTNAAACDGSWPSKITCEDSDALRNCIYASYGRPFTTKKWQEQFGKLGWYKPDPSYADTRLAPVASANIKMLAKLGCGKAISGQIPIELHGNADGSKELSYDLDGDGAKETLSLTPAKLTIGAASIATKWGENGSVVLLDLLKTDKRIELALIPEVIEDDATYQIYSYENGAIVHLGDVFVGGSPTVPGDGTLRVVLGNCGTTENQTWQLKGSALVLASSKKTGKYDPKQCAACPYVLSVGTGDRFEFRGKIARNLVGPAARAWQSVTLAPPPRGGPLRVRISERESERSFFEDIFVTIDGVRHDSQGTHGPLRLEYGDDADLVFDGPFAPDAVIELWAKGYYEPYSSPPPAQ